MGPLSGVRGIALLAVILANGAVAAADGKPFGGSVSLATEYVFRGISQTEEKPQLRAQVTWAHDSGVYLGVWSANTHFGGPGNSIEIDPFIGFSRSIGDGPWSYDVGYWHYHYPGARADLDFGEIYATLTRDVAPWTWQVSLWHARDYFGDDFFADEPATAYQGTGTYRFAGGVSLSATVGLQTFDEPDGLPGQDYRYGSVALAKKWERMTVELVGHETHGVEPELASDDLSEARLVARVMMEF